mgnify:CR=1 FL=1
MLIGILGVLIGIGVLAAGVYNLLQEKDDKESVKIYGTISAAGIIIVAAAIIKLIFFLKRKFAYNTDKRLYTKPIMCYNKDKQVSEVYCHV